MRGPGGRISSSSLQLVSPVTEMRRPPPPAELTKEQADEWRNIVESLRADWFSPENYALLTTYCTHICSARLLAKLIDNEVQAGLPDLGKWDTLLRMHERESKAIMNLSTRMRISQHSAYDKERSRKSSTQTDSRPWK